jgi:hypothetical protein
VWWGDGAAKRRCRLEGRVFDPVGTDSCGPWGPWCPLYLFRLRSLSAGASSAALARTIGELINQAGWTPSWTQIPVYAGSCTKSSRLTRRWGPFCAVRFQRLPARAAASATAHIALVREAGDRQGAVGRLVPPLEHLTGLRSVVAEAAWPGHRAALTGLTCGGGGRAPWRRGRGWQRQRRSIPPAPSCGPACRRRRSTRRRDRAATVNPALHALHGGRACGPL